MRERHFVIPTNFMESGYLFNGTVSIRNAVEAGVLALLGFLFCKQMPLPSDTTAITYYILICGPLALIGLFGVQGDPLSVFIVDFIKWRRRRKPFFYSGHSEAYTQEAADMLMDAPQFRDLVLDALEKVRASMASSDIEYVEGKTFEFAADPEQEALRQAQQEIVTKREEAEAKRQELLRKQQEALAAKNNPFKTPNAATAVSAQQVSQLIVLDNLDWEEEDNE